MTTGRRRGWKPGKSILELQRVNQGTVTGMRRVTLLPLQLCNKKALEGYCPSLCCRIMSQKVSSDTLLDTQIGSRTGGARQPP